MKVPVVVLSLFATLSLAEGALVGSWQFDDPENPLRATVGADAVAAEGNPSLVVEGLGSLEFIAGETEGDGAIAIPIGGHLLYFATGFGKNCNRNENFEKWSGLA